MVTTREMKVLDRIIHRASDRIELKSSNVFLRLVRTGVVVDFGRSCLPGRTSWHAATTVNVITLRRLQSFTNRRQRPPYCERENLSCRKDLL